MIDRPVSKGDVIRACKLKFRDEWKLDPRRIETRADGLTCVHLATDPENDVLGYAPDGMAVLKSVFLRFDKQLKHEIITHYRDLGFAWVDLVFLNRRDWKIFLFRENDTDEVNRFDPWSCDLFPTVVGPEVVMDANGMLYKFGQPPEGYEPVPVLLPPPIFDTLVADQGVHTPGVLDT